MCISTKLDNVVKVQMTVHTHTHIYPHTNTIQPVGVRDSITQLKCSEKNNVLSLFLKGESRRVSGVWVRLFLM